MSIFLSYSRRDAKFADVLYRLLESKGYDVWIDRRDIEAGRRWDDSIQEAIDLHSHLLVILSPDSVKSQNVADEWSYALDKGKTVIPLRYENCDVPLRLRRVQWIDFYQRNFAEALDELIAALGPPDARPSDRIQLAKRQGLVFIEIPKVDIRLAFVYTDYPFVTSFLKTVWFCLLWSIIPRGSTNDNYYDYGSLWVLRNKITGETYARPSEEPGVLAHEMGIEPDTELEIILLDR